MSAHRFMYLRQDCVMSVMVKGNSLVLLVQEWEGLDMECITCLAWFVEETEGFNVRLVVVRENGNKVFLFLMVTFHHPMP